MKGTKTHRHNSNPLEMQFHDSFIKECSTYDDMARIGLGTTDGIRPIDHLTEREEEIMINTIQWLGSPVGQQFLIDNGFSRVK